jgi:hypothetical protein
MTWFVPVEREFLRTLFSHMEREALRQFRDALRRHRQAIVITAAGTRRAACLRWVVHWGFSRPHMQGIWMLRNQSCAGTRLPSTSTPHWPACMAQR